MANSEKPAVRGVGSNQHSDKPPDTTTVPSNETGVGKTAGAAADADPLATPEPAPPAMPPPLGRRVQDPKPWEHTYPDGSPNPSSFEYQSVLATITMAHDILREHDPDSVSKERLESMSHTLLRMSDQAQAAVRPDGTVNRGDNSHTRARSAVYTSLNAFPPPFDSTDPEVWQTWATNVTNRATGIMMIAQRITSHPHDATEPPWKGLMS